MSYILKDFYQNYSNSPEDIILDNCKNFLSHKSISPSIKKSKLSQKNKKKSFLISQIDMFNPRNNVKLKLVDLSKLHGRNKKNKLFHNEFLNNINKSNFKGKKFLEYSSLILYFRLSLDKRSFIIIFTLLFIIF